MAGLPKPNIREFFFFGGGGDAGDDLADMDVKARMEYGTSRLGFAQVGNTWDPIVKFEKSFSSHGWEKLKITCPDSIGAHWRTRHTCVLTNVKTLSFIGDVLGGSPPLWASPEKRPDKYSEEINKGLFQKLWERFLGLFK